MKCPECGEEMEEDTLQEVASVAHSGCKCGDESTYNGTHQNGKLGVSVTHFRCNNCDSEWTRRGSDEIRMIDGAGRAPLGVASKPKPSFRM